MAAAKNWGEVAPFYIDQEAPPRPAACRRSAGSCPSLPNNHLQYAITWFGLVRYVSTRGEAPPLGFIDVTLAGLARDGGLYVPESWPRFRAGRDRRRWPAGPMRRSRSR